MDIYKEVTDRIIAQMENGIIPWQKPWISSGSCISHATGKAYSLLNQMLLGRPGEYVTFKQVQLEGGKVKKGEKASMVVFWKWIEEKDPETEEVKQIPFLRYYNVFHIDQCEGLKVRHTNAMPNTASADQTADAIITAYCEREGVKLIHEEGDCAFYRPATDSITLPHASFASTPICVFSDNIFSICPASNLSDSGPFFQEEPASHSPPNGSVYEKNLPNKALMQTVFHRSGFCCQPILHHA